MDLIRPKERILVRSNVVVALREPTRPPLGVEELLPFFQLPSYKSKALRRPDGVAQLSTSHNIVVNSGSQWLRNLICASGFPDLGVDDADADLGTAYSILPTPGSAEGDKKTYRVRWIAVGVGGILQSTSPPGAGTFIEDASVDGLENPYTITGPYSGSPYWMRQIEPIDDLSDIQLLPSEYAARFRAIFHESDISYVGGGDKDGTTYGSGLAIPLSEVGLYTSQADPGLVPRGDQTASPPGMIAYNIFETLTKTPHFVLEVAWELRF